MTSAFQGDLHGTRITVGMSLLCISDSDRSYRQWRFRLVPRVPRSETRTLKLCRCGDPGIFFPTWTALKVERRDTEILTHWALNTQLVEQHEKHCLSVLKLLSYFDYIMIMWDKIPGSPPLHNFNVHILECGSLGMRRQWRVRLGVKFSFHLPTTFRFQPTHNTSELSRVCESALSGSQR